MQLSEGEVHLWALPLDEAPLQQAEPPTLDLAVDERARAARMRCPQARSVFVQTRMALRALLGHYLDLPAGAVALSSGAWGKPQLGAGMGDLQFNVSHSGQLALIALSLSAVGVDLEWQQADLDWRELLPLCCHPAEQADFQDAADAQGRARLLRLWTAKEAYLKGRGEGLSLPLTAIRLSAGGGWQARIEAPWDAGQGWWLHALALPAGYLGCVATPFPSPLIRFQSLAELTSSARVESPHYPEVLSPLRESTMECIQSLPSSSAAFTLEHFRQQGPRELNANPYLQRQAARESNARSYPRRIPLALQEAHGMYVRDTQGQLFMDCLAGAGTLALGHNHPVAIAAMRQTLDAGLPLHTLDLTTPVKDRFVEELFAALPEAFARQARIQFCGPTGADGIEAALKLARIATGRKPILSFSGGYHGMTHGALSLMGNLGPKLALGAAMAEVQFLPYPYDYRCPFGIGGEAGIDAGLHYIEQLLSDPESGVLPPAAVVVEVVQGEGGVIPAPARWLQGLRQLTRKHGIVLIIDEVQTGLGRTGRLFAFEHADIEPDILVLSKALGGGLPLSVLVYRDELDTWKPGAHAGTFRGNQMAMAAGAATLRHILSENLPAHAATMGERLMGRLRQLQHDYPCLGDVRGRGLMVGVEIVGAADGSRVPSADSALAKAIQHQCLCLGIILELGGRHGAVVRFLPPLLIQPEEIDLLVERFQQALDQALAKVTSRALHIA